ncbi:sperm-associated antigen 11B-like [Castor canadensis]|uniref:Sperm-associated antigen 11-like n=1 Tax=Castor canadensis TaxID=51338 RepID=A0A8C0W068_CASCN|nr:sperm-associated antigen 11-like [Castor canadensis]
MKHQLLPPFTSLLLVTLLFPGLSSVWSLKHSGTEDSHDLKEESPREETNRSPLLHHLVKRYLLPRTPPFHEPEPNFKIVNCRRSEGFCQEYCNYMETQVGYCSKKKDPCCLHLN